VGVGENLEGARQRIRRACERAGRDQASVTLIGVAKRVPPERVREALEAGLRDIGENIVQEAAAKKPALHRPGLRWHLVGHLQRNKAAAAIETFDIIHSIDSTRLAEALSQRATGRLQVLLEVNIAREPSKFGFSVEELPHALEMIRSLSNLDAIGLMTVAPAVRDAEQVRPVFRELAALARAHDLSELSMGMTDDFEVAVEEGATMVRIGRALFGERAR
jgi:PLP dependent protein